MINKLVNSIYFQKPVSIQTAISAECGQENHDGGEYDLLFEAGKYISTLECLAEMLLDIVRHSDMQGSEIAYVLDDFIQNNTAFHEQTVVDAESLLWEEIA